MFVAVDTASRRSGVEDRLGRQVVEEPAKAEGMETGEWRVMCKSTSAFMFPFCGITPRNMVFA